MKKITKIEIENSRAYYDRLTFSMEKGENVLLYGENGSGKTSLYKSLNDFIQSFYSHVSYTTNRNKFNLTGNVLCLRRNTGVTDYSFRFFHNAVNQSLAQI